MSSKNRTKPSTPKKGLSAEQRARRSQSILFSILAGVMILSMIVALLAR